MCRAGGRRCEHNWTEQQRQADLARRRALYASRKQAKQAVEGIKQSETHKPSQSGLTDAQTAYFKDSVAKDSEGNLVKVFHGSSVEFDSFNPEMLGKGNDSWGNGFYFTTKEETARGYAVDSGSPTANVKEFYLNLKNPMFIDGKKYMSLNETYFDAETAAKIIKQHPDLYVQPNDEDRNSFIGDYSPEFWDKDEWTKEELDQLADKVIQEHFTDTSWVDLENLYGRDHGGAYLEAVHKATGHDGVIVDFGDDGKHYVAWFANQMKLTTNTTPEDNTQF